MESILKKEAVFLQRPLNLTSRLLLVGGSILLAVSIFLPLWQIRLIAPQYQEGLNLFIYAYKMVGGGLDGQHLQEINNLNHYIGMRPLKEADFIEMRWVPFALGLFVLLGLRAAVHGKMSSLLDLFCLFFYFGLFSMGSFYYRLYTYGHNLDPKAPVEIEPFTPVLLGRNEIANFIQWSFPHVGSYVMMVFPLAILLAGWFSRKESLES